MAKAGSPVPEDWMKQISDAMAAMRKERPFDTIFGVNLPSAWKSSLEQHVRNGDLRKLMKVNAISFSGSNITRLERPSK